MLAIDTETDLITKEAPVPSLISVAVAGAHGTSLFVAHDPRLERVLAGAFREGIAFANASFDVTAIWAAFPSLIGEIVTAYSEDRIVDVLGRERLIDIAQGRPAFANESLATVALRRAGITLNKNQEIRKTFGRLKGLELAQWPEAHRAYACADATATWCTYLTQEHYLQSLRVDVLAPQFDNVRADLALYLQSLTGIHTDPAWVEALDRRLAAEEHWLRQACMAYGLARYKHKIKRPSPVVRTKKAAQVMLQAAAKADTSIRVTYTKPKPKFPEGQVSLSEDALEAAGFPRGRDDDGNLDGAMHPLEAYRMLGSVGSRRTKTVPVLRHPIVRTSYDGCVSSGRTSSHGFGEDGAFGFWADCSSNWQNQERDNRVRGCLIPPPGCEFVTSDFGMLELVALAQVEIDVCGSSALADALNDGIDVHAQFGCDMIGIPLADFDKKKHKAARQGGKAWNFGKPGGMGQKRFIAWARKTYRVEVTPQEEREHTDRWFARYPEHDLFFKYVRRFEGPGGKYTILVPRCGHVRGGMRFPDACNTHFQTLGAYVAKRSLWKLFVAGLDPLSPLYGIYQVLFVHDEHVSVAPIGRGEACIPEQERLMVEASRELCPDVKMKIESFVSDRYKKD